MRRMRNRRRLDTALAGLATLWLLLAAFPARRPASGHPAAAASPDPAAVTAAPASSGAEAEAPEDIPPRGWWQVLKRVGADFGTHRIMAEAAAVTFYALLALFPALAALVSLYGLFANPASIQQQVDALNGVIPGGGMQIINGQLHNLAGAGHGALGIGFAIGLATSLWTANQGIKALFGALNAVHGETEKRSFFRLNAITLGFTLGIILFLIVALAGVVAVPIMLAFVGLHGAAGLLVRLARWPILLVLLMLFLAVVYRYGPSREHPRWQWVSWGSAFAAIAWIAASLLFSYYVSHFGSYNKTYGSLGAVIGFMTWMWISAIIVLLGAELNAELEAQTARDSTTGEPLPIGMRGAAKADQVAAA
jgi:membrane protein